MLASLFKEQRLKSYRLRQYARGQEFALGNLKHYHKNSYWSLELKSTPSKTNVSTILKGSLQILRKIVSQRIGLGCNFLKNKFR